MAMLPSNKRTKNDAAENIDIVIRNDDVSQRSIHIPKGTNVKFHFDGQFKDCSFNFHS